MQYRMAERVYATSGREEAIRILILGMRSIALEGLQCTRSTVHGPLISAPGSVEPRISVRWSAVRHKLLILWTTQALHAPI